MSAVFNLAIPFETQQCCDCGATFAMTVDMQRRRLDDGKSFFCPNGHSQHYTETRIQKLQKELEQEKKRREWAEESRKAAYARETSALNSRNAMKGVLTKMKKRVAHGVCPCCKRTFQQLSRHMKMKHPDFEGTEA